MSGTGRGDHPHFWFTLGFAFDVAYMEYEVCFSMLVLICPSQVTNM